MTDLTVDERAQTYNEHRGYRDDGSRRELLFQFLLLTKRRRNETGSLRRRRTNRYPLRHLLRAMRRCSEGTRHNRPS
jgi:hypothetical protein